MYRILISLLFISIAHHVSLSAQIQPLKTFQIRASIMAGGSPELFISGKPNAVLGARVGVQNESGIYLGGVWSIHPLGFSGGIEPSGAAPIAVCAETGYEFVLTPTMFLRPYLGIGRVGVENSFKGWGGLTIGDGQEKWTFTFGVLYSIEVAQNLLLGAEIRAVNGIGIHALCNIGYRF